MRCSKYTIFLKVVELESFSKTADFYKYSQSAVTQIVKSLEAELQMTLLKRSHAGVCLTSDGEQILPYIRELAIAEEKMWEKAGEITGMHREIVIAVENEKNASVAVKKFLQFVRKRENL